MVTVFRVYTLSLWERARVRASSRDALANKKTGKFPVFLCLKKAY